MFNNVFKDLRYKFWEHFSLLCKWPLDPLNPSLPIVNIVFPSGSNVSTRLKKKCLRSAANSLQRRVEDCDFNCEFSLRFPTLGFDLLTLKPGQTTNPQLGFSRFPLETSPNYHERAACNRSNVSQVENSRKLTQRWDALHRFTISCKGSWHTLISSRLASEIFCSTITIRNQLSLK